MSTLRLGGIVVERRKSLVERLGYDVDAKLVIVNCDDLGSSEAANSAIYSALRGGVVTSASLMVPCAAASDAVRQYQGEDVGVHLTLNAEWSTVRWGPLTPSPSLRDHDGAFFTTPDATHERASLAEILMECEAQIERALSWGIDVTHLDSHMHALLFDDRISAVYVQVGAKYGLPVRLPSRTRARRAVRLSVSRRPSRARELADSLGVVAPDYLAFCPIPARSKIRQVLPTLRPGLTEMFLHPADDSPELRATHPDWEGRIDDRRFVEDELGQLLRDSGATLIGYRELRELQRGDN